jgi:hypothetical protein
MLVRAQSKESGWITTGYDDKKLWPLPYGIERAFEAGV